MCQWSPKLHLYALQTSRRADNKLYAAASASALVPNAFLLVQVVSLLGPLITTSSTWDIRHEGAGRRPGSNFVAITLLSPRR